MIGIDSLEMFAKVIGLIAGIIGGFGVIFGVVFGVYKWFLRQGQQDKEIEELKKKEQEDMKALQDEFREAIKRIKEENALKCYALRACLDGLEQLGANHIVPVAREKLEKYLNLEAHK